MISAVYQAKWSTVAACLGVDLLVTWRRKIYPLFEDLPKPHDRAGKTFLGSETLAESILISSSWDREPFAEAVAMNEESPVVLTFPHSNRPFKR